MKYSFMTSSCAELPFEEVLAIARQYGYDGVELRIDNDHHHGIEPALGARERKDAKSLASDAGIALCCVATSFRFSDPATVEAAVAGARDAIGLASDLGAPCVRVFGGVIAAGLSRADAVAQVTRSLGCLADHAQQSGVCLCLETHDDWCDPADVARVIREVEHPAVGVTWDLMHPVMTAGKSIDETFETLAPWIRHVHFHDGFWQDGVRVMAPVGQGCIDHRRALELLNQSHYEGFISGEWIRWRPHAEHLPQELATLKEIEKCLQPGKKTP